VTVTLLNPSKPCHLSTWQKLSQLTEEQHADLHDLTCCWLWVKERLKKQFPGELVEKHEELFYNGNPGLKSKPPRNSFKYLGSQLILAKWIWLSNHGSPNEFG